MSKAALEFRVLRFATVAMVVAVAISLNGCAAKFLKVEGGKSDDLTTIEEYDQLVKVKQIGGAAIVQPSPSAVASPAPSTAAPSLSPGVSPALQPVPEGQKSEKKTSEKGKGGKVKLPKDSVPKDAAPKDKPTKDKKQSLAKPSPAPSVPSVRQPELEDSEGFVGRRPILDPFRPGEKTVLKLSYFNIAAGELTIEVLPFVEVNGRKAYHFQMLLKSYAVFSSFYSVDDSAETFLDYENLTPFNFAIHVKESKQLREVRSFMDWDKMEARFWEKKITKESGIETKNLRWDILPYTQNVITAAYYLRLFSWKPGKSVQFRVADDGKNMVVKGEVVRREILETEQGKFPALVLKPEIAIEGVFKPMGDIFFWLTDDDRKQIIRIESKIRIGKIVGDLKELVRGNKP